MDYFTQVKVFFIYPSEKNCTYEGEDKQMKEKYLIVS